jgi:hypothetical protein
LKAQPALKHQEKRKRRHCDRCDVYSENLKNVNGQYLCEDCRIEVENEK